MVAKAEADSGAPLSPSWGPH